MDCQNKPSNEKLENGYELDEVALQIAGLKSCRPGPRYLHWKDIDGTRLNFHAWLMSLRGKTNCANRGESNRRDTIKARADNKVVERTYEYRQSPLHPDLGNVEPRG